MKPARLLGLAIVLTAGYAPAVCAQGTAADYERANGLRAKYEGLVANLPGNVTWIENTHRFWYRKVTRGGYEFVMVDADTQRKAPAFDHARLAAALSKATGKSYPATTLPFTNLTIADDEKTLDGTFDGTSWSCTLTDYVCSAAEPRRRTENTRPRVSPDKKWEALINNFNIAVRPVGGRTTSVLSLDGSEGNYYELSSIAWSPDSKKIAAYRVKPGYRRDVHYVQSSPEDQLQPKYSALRYAKPGDVLDLEQPVLFDVSSKTAADHRQQPLPQSLRALAPGGEKTAAPSPSNTTSAVTRCIASSRSTPPPARPAR